MAKPGCKSRTLTFFWQYTLAQDAILTRWSSAIKKVCCHLMYALWQWHQQGSMLPFAVRS